MAQSQSHGVHTPQPVWGKWEQKRGVAKAIGNSVLSTDGTSISASAVPTAGFEKKVGKRIHVACEKELQMYAQYMIEFAFTLISTKDNGFRVQNGLNKVTQRNLAATLCCFNKVTFMDMKTYAVDHDHLRRTEGKEPADTDKGI